MFDGDVLNMIAIFEDEFIRMFRNFDPIEKYIISRTTGKLDSNFTITKGQLIDLCHFATFEESEPVNEIDPDSLLPLVNKMKEEHETNQFMEKQKKFQVTFEFPKVKIPDSYLKKE